MKVTYFVMAYLMMGADWSGDIYPLVLVLSMIFVGLITAEWILTKLIRSLLSRASLCSLSPSLRKRHSQASSSPF